MKSFNQSRKNIPHVYQEAFEVLRTFSEKTEFVAEPQTLRGNNHEQVLSLGQICVDETADVVSESRQQTYISLKGKCACMFQ